MNSMCDSSINSVKPWSIQSSTDWMQAKASTNKVGIQNGWLVLEGATEGQWTSTWHDWQDIVDSAEICIETEIDLFDNKKIETVVQGSLKPYTDANGVQHTWYGRCMIAIIDSNRWIMAIRSGVSHISWGNRDTIHIGPMHLGTDTGYGDLKCRVNNTFVAATYYANRDSTVADVEQYTFGGERAFVMLEADGDGDSAPDKSWGWYEVYNGRNVFCLSALSSTRFRFRLMLNSTHKAGSPKIRRVTITPF